LPCAADRGFPSLTLHLRNELVNTNKAEGRLDPITLMCREVALFSNCNESIIFQKPPGGPVGGIQGCALGHWSEMM